MPESTWMESIEIDVRYYHLPSKAYVDEPEFHLRTLQWKLPVNRIALVLVDVWADLYVRSHLDRGREITLSRIRPLLEAFRRIGATVIHAPSPVCARRYAQYVGDAEAHEMSPSKGDDWPPSEFRSRSGDYEQWARPADPEDRKFDEIIANRSINPEVAPQEGDHVIATGDQLHRLLKHQRILWLFYVGFAANLCVPFRDYGMRAMQSRGYGIVLVRDCTAGLEVADTFEEMLLSRAAVVDVELSIGHTVSSSGLLRACASK
ncbi:MAG: hypothetical protein CMJ18_12425 [Phycisphaeraceae bacterium]|nr:hypothetical protein [Phycisphaeraceae bacterium]